MTWQTVVVVIVLLVIVVAIIAKGISNIKKGKISCSCGCKGCALEGKCHSKEE